MKTTFRYRGERHFDRPPEAIWPALANSARINELSGSAAYTYRERIDAAGRLHRVARGRFGPMWMSWEESVGEWEENRGYSQVRQFLDGPFRRFYVNLRIEPEPTGCRLVFVAEIDCVGLLGLAGKLSGLVRRECAMRVDTHVRVIEELARPEIIPGEIAGGAIKGEAKRRFDAAVATLGDRALAAKLASYLDRAPISMLRGLRPLAFAREWGVAPERAVELFLAAQRAGILAMGWDLLCPRCRGAKSRVANLHDLPTGAHCSSCNIDYGRDFTRNVELTFRPEPWLRQLPEGEFCMLGQGSTPHVKLQAEVPAGAARRYAMPLAPGPYRFRTVEADGGEANAEIGADGAIPSVTARGGEIVLGPATAGEIAIANETDGPLVFVVESREWARDALTGERVIAMPSFRRLAPEQLLRPGDDAEIGRAIIMFTDLQGSTKLYDSLGDARAYHLVRDHFAYLSERIGRHGGAVVKTVGDAVMAVFQDPAGAVRAALAIQDEIEAFNEAEATKIVLKLGLHAGSCIAVTTGNVLDYFGSTVNTASRLEHQCEGGEIIVSSAILADPEANAALGGRRHRADSAMLRGLADRVEFVRVAHGSISSDG